MVSGLPSITGKVRAPARRSFHHGVAAADSAERTRPSTGEAIRNRQPLEVNELLRLSSMTDDINRREFLSLTALIALAGLHGCSAAKPEHIVPYVRMPENVL